MQFFFKKSSKLIVLNNQYFSSFELKKKMQSKSCHFTIESVSSLEHRLELNQIKGVPNLLQC